MSTPHSASPSSAPLDPNGDAACGTPRERRAAPYADALEHLADHIQRIAHLVAAHLARLPERRRGLERRDPQLASALRFGYGEDPPETKQLLASAARKLVAIRRREAATHAVELPLCRLASSFGLSQTEQDALVLCAAPKIDPRYAEHWEASDVDVNDPSVRTAIAILTRTFEEGVAMRRLFGLTAPLVAQSLLLAERRGASEGDFLEIRLEVPRRVVGELLGESHVAEELVAFSRLHTPRVPLDQVVLPPAQKDLVLSLVRNHPRFLERRRTWGLDDVVTYGRGLVLLFAGPPGTGKTMLANAVAHELGKRIFSVDVSKLVEAGRGIETNLDAVFREARLLDAVLFFDECEQIFASRRSGNEAMPLLLTRIEQFDGVAILATNMEQLLDEALARRVIAKIDFRPPATSARAEIWRKHLPPALPVAADLDVDRLAAGYDLSGGTIKNAVLAAVVRAVGRGAEELTMADLEHGARLQIRVTGDDLDHLIVPEAGLDHVVLPPGVRGSIDRFVSAARVQTTVLAEWGFGRTLGRGTGLAALFHGAPGTGKSITAEAVASALDRPLLRCNLASVVSKWVGDTAKNLERLFQAAREHRAVLVFDEADALFARRVGVRTSHDRFANAETGALLTQLERHDGIVILTTNLVEELDPAFERRLQFRVAFPLPDARARAAIWRTLLPADAPLAGDVDVAQLGRAFELSGGAIRNAVLAAALEAASLPAGERRITLAMLVRGAEAQGGREPVADQAPYGVS